MSVAVTLPARATRPPDVVAENDIGQRLYHTPRKELKPVKMTAPRRSRPVIVHKIGGSVLGAVVICRAPSDRGLPIVETKNVNPEIITAISAELSPRASHNPKSPLWGKRGRKSRNSPRETTEIIEPGTTARNQIPIRRQFGGITSISL